MKIVYFNFAAVAVLAVIIISALYKKMTQSMANRAFLWSVAIVFISTVFDIWAVALDNDGAGNVALKYFAHSGYLITHTMTSLFYLVYLISLTDTWHKIMEKKLWTVIMVTPGAVYLIMHLLQYLGGPDIFYIDKITEQYTRAGLFFLNYAVAIYYMLFGAFYIIKYRRLFTSGWLILLFSPYPFIILATVIELLIPTMIIELLFNSLALLFIFANIHNPEDTIDKATGLGTMDACIDYCRRIYQTGKPVYAIIIEMLNFEQVRRTLDYESGLALRERLARFISSENDRLKTMAQLFYGHNGKFFIFVNESHSKNLEAIIASVVQQLNRDIVLGTVEIKPQTIGCIAKLPDDFEDYSMYAKFATYPLDEIPAGTVTTASALMGDRHFRILMDIDRIISDAIEKKRLEVFYQPIYSFKDRRFVSAEALLRLKDPEFGYVSPGLFIPAAEQNGQISDIWNFVIKSVCDFINEPEFKRSGIEYIEVNLSAVQCLHEHLAEQILAQIDNNGVDRNKISIEITETALIANPEALRNNLQKLSEAGIHICLDDYGTGYSDTRRIMDLPLDIVKLDKSFIQGLEEKRISGLICDTVHMLKNFGVGIVAEGVETRDELEHLRECGVDNIQGYYFSGPMPKGNFVTRCANQQ